MLRIDEGARALFPWRRSKCERACVYLLGGNVEEYRRSGNRKAIIKLFYILCRRVGREENIARLSHVCDLPASLRRMAMNVSPHVGLLARGEASSVVLSRSQRHHSGRFCLARPWRGIGIKHVGREKRKRRLSTDWQRRAHRRRAV